MRISAIVADIRTRGSAEFSEHTGWFRAPVVIDGSTKDNILDAHEDFHYNRSLVGQRLRNVVNQRLEGMSPLLQV